MIAPIPCDLPLLQIPSPHHGAKREYTRNIVIHCTDGSEAPGAGRNCAEWFASPLCHASAHTTTDAGGTYQSVDFDSVAWHAGRTANHTMEGHEICGRASQSAEQWADAQSTLILRRAVWVFAWRLKVRGLPAVYVDYTGLRRQQFGLTTHDDVTRAFGESTHHDPGASFPLADFVASVRACLATL